MPAQLPMFNCRVSQWFAPRTPASGAADATHVHCQIYMASKGLLDIQPGTVYAWVPPVFIRLPLGATSLRVDDIFMDEDHPTEYYKVRFSQRMHVNFPNEYITTIVEHCTSAGVTPVYVQ